MRSITLNTLTEILNTLKEPGWYVAIGTLLLAWATFRSLNQYRKSEQKRRDIDTLEKVIKPLSDDLKKMACCLKGFELPSSFGRYHGKSTEEGYPLWEKIKQETSYLLGNLDKKTRKKLEEFSQGIKSLIFCHNQSSDQLWKILYEEIKSKVKEQYWNEIGQGMYYEATIGGKPIKVSLKNLLFRNQTLEEYLEERSKDPVLLNKKIENESFMMGGTKVKDFGREDFAVIHSNIQQKISKKPKLQELIEISRRIHREVRSLREDLDK